MSSLDLLYKDEESSNAQDYGTYKPSVMASVRRIVSLSDEVSPCQSPSPYHSSLENLRARLNNFELKTGSSDYMHWSSGADNVSSKAGKSERINAAVAPIAPGSLWLHDPDESLENIELVNMDEHKRVALNSKREAARAKIAQELTTMNNSPQTSPIENKRNNSCRSPPRSPLRSPSRQLSINPARNSYLNSVQLNALFLDAKEKERRLAICVKEYYDKYYPESHTREALHHLGTFIYGSSIRKVLSNWNLFESRFHYSSHAKVVYVKNNSTGLNDVVHHKALPLSSMIGILCSQKVRVNFNELEIIFEHFKIPRDEMFRGRAMAAAKALMSHNACNHIEHDNVLDEELSSLITAGITAATTTPQTEEQTLDEELGERLISIEEFREVIFAGDENQRQKQEELVAAAKELMLLEHMLEKKKKQDMSERGEKRKKKASADFKAYLREIQFSKGVMTLSRIDAMKNVIENARKLNEEMSAVGVVHFPHEITELMGLQCFPLHKRQELKEDLELHNSKKADAVSQDSKSRHLSLAASKRKAAGEARVVASSKAIMGYSGQFRLHLEGPPPVLETLKLAVSYGRGLSGLSYRDVVEMLQAYASTRLQGAFRSYTKRWRFRRARNLWRTVFGSVKLHHFKAWSRYSRYRFDLRYFCWRKVIAWRRYTVCAIIRRSFFKACYWPFYVWHRYANRCGMAKEKTRFLVTRVVPTYQKLQVFHAWRKESTFTRTIREKALAYHRSLILQGAQKVLTYMHQWARQKKILRRSWFKEGLIKLKKNIFKCKNVPFQIWRAYVFYKKSSRSRIRDQAAHFRNLMMPNVACRAAPNRTAHRVKLRAAALKVEKEARKLRKKLEKEQQELMQRAFAEREAVKNKIEAVQEEKAKKGHHGHKTPVSSPTRNPVVYGGDGASTPVDKDEKKKPKVAEVKKIELVEEPFEWYNYEEPFDFDSDDDEDLSIPTPVLELYETKIESLKCPREVEFLQWSVSSLIDEVRYIQDEFKLAESWALLEYSTRYHRLARRVLQNMHYHAIIRRNAREAVLGYHLKLKRMVFTSLAVWVHRDSSADNSNLLVQIDFSDQTEAERLSNVVRNARLAKLMRRRVATAEEKALGRFHNEVMEVVNPHSGIRKTLNNAMRIAAALAVPSRSNRSSPVRSATEASVDISIVENESAEEPPRSPPTDADDFDDLAVIVDETTGEPPSDLTLTDMEILQKMERTLSSPVVTFRKNVQKVRKPSLKPSSSPLSQTNGDARPATSPVRSTHADGKLSGSTVSKRLRSVTALASDSNKKRGAIKTKADLDHEDLMYCLSDNLHQPAEHCVTRVICCNRKRRKNYKKPDILSWDQADRTLEMEQAESMMALCRHYKEESSKACIEADLVTKEANSVKTREKVMLDEIIQEEDVSTKIAIKNENKYASEFKIHAADNMLIVLVRIYKEVVVQIMKAEAKKYFRALRGPMAERRSVLLCNRKKMVNWIRLCKRMSCMYNNIDKYYIRRRQWIIFNRWLKLTEKESLTATPGLVDEVVRLCELHPGFNDSLAAKGFIPVVYANNTRLQAESADFIAVFFRWQMYWSTKKVFGMLKAKATLLHKLRLMKRVFYALKTKMTTEETYGARVRDAGFPILRILTDMDQITKRFLAIRSRGLSSIIGIYNRKFIAQQQKDARNGPSFKRFLQEFKSDVAYRLTTEQRVLNESFALRGIQRFKDVRATEAKIPNAMSRLDGKSFCDPIVENCEIGTEIPGGFKLIRILLNFQDGAGIVGWQLVWGADTCAEIESPKRGLWSGAAMSEKELLIPLTDFLFGIEYLYEGSTIMGLRLKLFFGGWTKWVGKRTSMSTLSLYICADHALKEKFEDDYEPVGEDEKKHPAFPRSFIIGFSGLENIQKLTTNLSVVVRKVISQHIFSYHWVQDELNRKADAVKEQQRSLEENESEEGAAEYSSSNDSKSDSEDEEGDDVFGELNLSLITSVAEPNSPQKSTSRQSKVFGNQKELQYKKRQASKAAMMKRKNSRYVDPKVIANFAKATGTDVIQDLSSEEPSSADTDSLLPAEIEFFAVCRMRNTEIRALESRSEAFARRLWTKKLYRVDPVLSVFTQLHILTSLTKWFFNALCRRLCNIKRSESQGTSFLNESLVLMNKAENARRKAFQLNRQAKDLEVNMTEQPWAANAAFKLLSPSERIERKAYLDEIKRIKEQAIEEEVRMGKLQEASAISDAQGRKLLPRLQLSQYVCNFYKVKVEASRHMQSLLKRMDMNTIKASLNGAVSETSGLSKVQMDIIRQSLMKKEEAENSLHKLGDVENAVIREAQRSRMLKVSRKNHNVTFRKPVQSCGSFEMVHGSSSCSTLIGAGGFKSVRKRTTKTNGESYSYQPTMRASVDGSLGRSRARTPAVGSRKSIGDISMSDSVCLPNIHTTRSSRSNRYG